MEASERNLSFAEPIKFPSPYLNPASSLNNVLSGKPGLSPRGMSLATDSVLVIREEGDSTKNQHQSEMEAKYVRSNDGLVKQHRRLDQDDIWQGMWLKVVEKPKDDGEDETR
jgi:hypothetical protein